MKPMICTTNADRTNAPRQTGMDAPENGIQGGLTLVLPAYNEAHAISHSILAAVAALGEFDIPWEILVVDDGSTDETAAIARNAAREFPQVRVLSLPQNTGYGAALRFGFRQARFDRLAFTDADGQFDLRELARLLAPSADFDLVCGYRIDRQDHWTRKLYSRGYNLVVQTLLGTRVRDCDCALKILRRDQIAELRLESNDYFINAELLTKARLADLSVTEVGVSHFPRLRGESKVSIWHVFPVLATLIRFWWSQVLFSRPDLQVKIPVSGRARWAAGLLLGLIAVLLLLPNLSYPLIDPDESRYAEISREMLESGDFIVPTRFGKPYLDKPPLLYWLTAASFQLFGVSESSARLVPALAALLTIIATYTLGSRLLGHAAAWLGVLSLLCCFGFLISGRFVFIDTLLMLCTTVCFLTGYLACREKSLHIWWWLASAGACALGVLAKGPVAAVLCLPPLVASRWLTGFNMIRPKSWALFAAIVGAVTLPWFLLVNARQSGFLAEFFWTHHFNRFISGLSHEEPWWYYVPVLVIGMLPCSMLFPAAVAFLLDRHKTTRPWRSWDVGFMVLAAGWTFLLFSCSSCKLPPYLLPAVPMICLVVGRGLETILSGSVENRFLSFVRRRSPLHLMLFMLVAALICGSVDIFALTGLAAGRLPHWVALIAGGSLVIGASQWELLQRGLISWGATALLAVVSMGVAMHDFYPGIAMMRSKVSPLVELCHAEIDRSVPIICYSLSHEADSLAFQLGQTRVQNYDTNEVDQAVSAMIRVPEMVVLANENEVADLRTRLPAGVSLSELAHYRHIFVGRCVLNPRIATRE